MAFFLYNLEVSIKMLYNDNLHWEVLDLEKLCLHKYLEMSQIIYQKM